MTNPAGTAAAPAALTPASAQPKFDPTGKTFLQRLDAMIADAKATHGVTLRKDSGRTAEWQQRMHVAHMFLFNAYQSTKPAKVDAGKKTIAWSHLSDAKVVWSTVKAEDLLRTKTGAPPTRAADGWAKDLGPDEEATKTHLKDMLKKAGIGKSGEAMVSAGLAPCAEPCKCGAGRSKHLEDNAADINTTDITSLEAKLTAAKAGTIDEYLKKFGLHRPLKDHAESPEPWHLEST